MHHNNEIEDQIKRALAGFEEDYQEGAWENFVRKRNRKRGITIRLISSAAAAVIIPVLLLLTGVFDRSDNQSPADSQKISVLADLPVNVSESEISSRDSSNSGIYNLIDPAIRSKSSENTLSASKLADSAILVTTIAQNLISEAGFADSLVLASNLASKLADSLISSPLVKPESRSESKNAIAGISQSDLTRDTITKSVIALSLDDWGETRESSTKYRRGEGRKVRFGINFSPGFNSTSDASAFNYGGGLNVDFALTDKIQISTGVQLEHQNVDSRDSYRDAAVPSNHTRATLTNLDIPVNITFSLYSGRNSNYYVGGGISSLAFLSEKYRTVSYKQELREKISLFASELVTTYSVENVETVSTTTVSPDKVPEIGGRVNLIFGYQQRLTPRLYLNIEPYLKIPVTGMASRNLIYTTGGVMCKISF